MISTGCRTGRRVRVGGVVAVRQRPETATRGAVLTLEDETSASNVMGMPDLFQRERQLLRTASLLAVEGQVERVDGVTHVRAARVNTTAALAW